MGRLGAPRLRGCIVTQPPSLCSFVERKKGVGVIYQLGFSHFCLGEAHVLQVSVEPKTPCAPGRLQRGLPGSITPKLRVGWAPSQLCRSFPAYVGAASLGVKDLGRGEGVRVSKLHPQMCLGSFAFCLACSSSFYFNGPETRALAGGRGVGGRTGS